MMNNTELCYLPATEALQLFRTHKLSPVELMEAQIKRADQVEPIINAFTDTFYDQALKKAKAAEKRYMDPRGRVRKLEGLTVAVKDEMEVKGQRNTQGSLTLKDYIATATDPAVERLLRAGAIIHARTTTPEFSCAWITHTRLHGTTPTPWNPKYTSSGSSGGSAASLAAGTSSLATGSDIGGSIRGPAAACGVVGYKPPYGRVPQPVPFNLDWYCHVGPLARTVADCALMQNVMSGIHPKDITTLRQKVTLPNDYPGIEGWRVAFSLDVGNGVVAQEVEEATHRTMKVLEDLGARVEEVELGWGPEIKDAARSYLDHLFGRMLARAYEESPDLLCDYTKYYAQRAGTCGQEKFLWTYEICGRMYETMGPLLNKFDAFICPTFVTHEIRADQMPWETMSIRGRTIDTDYDCSLMPPFNMLSRLPVLAIPAGMAPNGLPVGIQVVARSYDDKRVFQLAAALEKAQPWLDCVDRRPNL
jgi:Asp-tRNA(Asn)/Glu-tRNA(Gln) amidotransferase A subunit family amidase